MTWFGKARLPARKPTRRAPQRSRRLLVEPLECRQLLAADLEVTIADAPDPVVAGQNLTYTITLTNIGDTAVDDIQLNDMLPTGTSLVSWTQTSGTTTFSLVTGPAFVNAALA